MMAVKVNIFFRRAKCKNYANFDTTMNIKKLYLLFTKYFLAFPGRTNMQLFYNSVCRIICLNTLLSQNQHLSLRVSELFASSKQFFI